MLWLILLVGVIVVLIFSVGVYVLLCCLVICLLVEVVCVVGDVVVGKLDSMLLVCSNDEVGCLLDVM